ncbi:serine/threonine-protein kinase [Streptomyces sp. NBC_00059]|uniref:serine/threonine-protein kinase n=1 Tax=Streptomyces sp. NBC_00059 TaxID=2975635 RepID=UPI002257833B|nr:serine/threonine-protein kinase [Streptomyces sp. NBC_00059]MCX5410551.1 serine/threonine protein kinase [Streptomyces sp. NBC_00059]
MSHTTEVFQPLQSDDPPSVGGYRFAARLGAGGMGRVYLSHTQGGRPVAIKVVRPELADDPDFRRRFAREIKAARQVKGAYTAELIDADADGVPPWLATLYVPGPSLTQAVTRRGPLPVPAVLWLMAGVAEALQVIHAEGIVHRDLKPSNVLLAPDGPRVIDFGIALAAGGTSYTAPGSTIGTPSFMAPEQVSGGEITPAADVFALGQTAAFAALGRTLYGDGPAVNVQYRILHSEPDLSLLPDALRPLFARCLAAEPTERATPAEIVEWCRQRLGAEAGTSGGPAVWQEVAGPETVAPVPVPDPTPALPQQPTLTPTAATASAPLLPPPYPQPQFGWPKKQLTAQERRTRRRRTALITAAGVTGGLLLVVALAWTLTDAIGRFGDDDASGSRTSATGPAAQSSASPSGSSPGPSSDAEDASEKPDSSGPTAVGAGDDTSGSDASATDPDGNPWPQVFAPVTVDAKNRLSLENPPSLKGNKGDIYLSCKEIGCALKGEHTVFMQMMGGHGTDLDMCRLMLNSADKHSWTLAAAAAGTEFCMKDDKGNIGLLVIQTKSTSLPELAFVQGDLTVWPNADR